MKKRSPSHFLGEKHVLSKIKVIPHSFLQRHIPVIGKQEWLHCVREELPPIISADSRSKEGCIAKVEQGDRSGFMGHRGTCPGKRKKLLKTR